MSQVSIGHARSSAIQSLFRRGSNELRDKVVVITGASSGLGRAAALQFAAEGTALVLAARRSAALEETAELCRRAGGRAICQITDVTVEEQVKRLAEVALTEFGRIDVWVNNAGVSAFASLEEGNLDIHRRVIETNLWGAIYGGRAVMPIFRRQKHGTIINVGSILSKIGQPFVPSYVISKFALRGVSEAWRAEVADEPDIHVCTIYPYAMDTPHFESGANRVDRPAHPMSPLQSPEKVAAAIVDLAIRPRRERNVPRSAVLGLALHAAFPKTVERLLLDALGKWHFSHERQGETSGNLYKPQKQMGRVHGERQPQVSTWRLMVWTLGRLSLMPFAALIPTQTKDTVTMPPAKAAQAHA